MNQIFTILNQLAATDSTKEKEKILSQNKSNALLERIFYMTYCKQVSFGITPRGLNFTGSVGPMTLEAFTDELMAKYATRKLTGHAGMHYMQQMLDSMTSESCEVARRILNRDLECGTGATLANKIWEGLVPKQPCFLSESFSLKNLAKIIFPAYAQLKADGSRAMALITRENGDIRVSMMSRAGNEYYGLTAITEQLIDVADIVYAHYPEYGDFVIDGEIIHNPARFAAVKPRFSLDDLFGTLEEVEEVVDVESIESARTTSNGLANKSLNNSLSEQEQSEMVFNVWDIIPMEVYFSRKPSVIQYEDRYKMLIELVGLPGSNFIKNIDLIENEVVETYEAALAVYRKYVNQMREGIILKNIHGLWADARTTDQIKFKEEIEIDLLIKAVYPHKKDPTKLGGVTLVDASGQIEVDCGSGFKDKTHNKVGSKKVEIPLSERHEYDRQLLMSQGIVGEIAQIKCNGLLTRKNRKPHEPKYRLFLPIFQHLRRDKSEPNHIHDVFPDAILD
ncbi:ATP-dependent DNA ligase [Aeromonas phage GomatiRiver_11]|nr:DNA ligase [Aeromonas phage AhFM11]WKW84174.1 ATP-dependent DNA ligase [Aeromonas phage GomatiRiver_11]